MKLVVTLGLRRYMIEYGGNFRLRRRMIEYGGNIRIEETHD